jgi:hypothetical protein
MNDFVKVWYLIIFSLHCPLLSDYTSDYRRVLQSECSINRCNRIVSETYIRTKHLEFVSDIQWRIYVLEHARRIITMTSRQRNYKI